MLLMLLSHISYHNEKHALLASQNRNHTSIVWLPHMLVLVADTLQCSFFFVYINGIGYQGCCLFQKECITQELSRLCVAVNIIVNWGFLFSHLRLSCILYPSNWFLYIMLDAHPCSMIATVILMAAWNPPLFPFFCIKWSFWTCNNFSISLTWWCYYWFNLAVLQSTWSLLIQCSPSYGG
jgi:hypothetical protein